MKSHKILVLEIDITLKNVYNNCYVTKITQPQLRRENK